MANQLGYLVKRNNGRYYARFQKRDGRWSHESLGATRAAEAKVLFERWKQRRLAAKEREQEDIRPVPLAKLAEEHLRQVERHQAKSWLIKQRNYLENYLLPFLGERTLSTDLSPRRIRDYIDWRKDEGGIRSVTANKELSCLKAMFRFAEERGYVLESPARRVKLLQSDSIVHDRFLTYQEYLTLVAKAKEERSGVRSTLFNDRWEWVVLACNTGMRPGEQRVLEFADIDLQHGFLRIQSKPGIGFHVKNYQHRYIPLTPGAREAVQAQFAKKHPASDFVFHRPDGSAWGDIGNSIDDLAVSADLQRKEPPQRLTPHSLRHTFASWLAIAGVSLRRIQELLGHKSITTTERYSHLGHNGSHSYYFELAASVVNNFVPRFVTSPLCQGVPESLEAVENTWWRRGDSNARPRDYETLALAS
jgi:site-specific recombinase XerD